MTSEILVYRAGHGVITREQAAEIDRHRPSLDATSDLFVPDDTAKGGRWVIRDGKMVDASEAAPINLAHSSGPIVRGDIEPYRSAVTGEMITGRRQHRDHLARHDCVEVGNERLRPPPVESTGVEQSIRRAQAELAKPPGERSREFVRRAGGMPE